MIRKNGRIFARRSFLNSVDTAELFKDLEDSEILILFRLLPKDIAAEVFSYLSGDDQMTIIKAITDKEVTYIMDELYFDDMIDFLEELPSNMVKRSLKIQGRKEKFDQSISKLSGKLSGQSYHH